MTILVYIGFILLAALFAPSSQLWQVAVAGPAATGAKIVPNWLTWQVKYATILVYL